MHKMVERFYTKDNRWKLLLAQLLLLYVPLIQFFSIRTDNGIIPASACYFFSLVFVPYLIRNIKTLRLPPWYLTALYFYVMLLAAMRISQYGLSKSVLHWTFGFYLLIVILNVGAEYQKEEWLRMLETGACIFAVVHFIFILFHWEIVCFLLKGYFWGEINGGGGMYLPSLTRGGRNLDCTWLGLGAFFVRGKKKLIYVTYAILFSFLGGSRVGVIAIGMAVLWSLIYDPIYKLTVKKIKWYALYATILLLILFCSGMAQAFLLRMFSGIESPGQWLQSQEINNIFTSNSSVSSAADIQELPIDIQEPSVGTQEPSIALNDPTVILSGRAAIWMNVPKMIKDNPFGYGVGNAMRVMKTQYGFSSYEDIVHNVFFQWLVDEGILGGIAYLSLLAAFLHRQWKKRPHFFQSAFDGYFLTYFVLSMVQFHGGEALMIFVLGIALMRWKATFISTIPWLSAFNRKRPL